MLKEFIHEPRIAYFSMEIALRNEMPTYAGGLGVLAGEAVRFDLAQENGKQWVMVAIRRK